MTRRRGDPSAPGAAAPPIAARPEPRAASRLQLGQALVLFAVFLTVLLGISALGIDYATWLLTDRRLQNLVDSASVAGASQFGDRIAQGNCSGGVGAAKCDSARLQSWTSLNDALELGMSQTTVACLAAANSPAAGETDSSRALSVPGCGGEPLVSFGDTLWVSTPPPNSSEYTGPGIGGRYPNNFGIVFVRVDRPVQSFFGRVLGIAPTARIGWATAGALSSDFALQLFCRDNIAPEDGVCVNSAGLTIDGQGGIRLVRGDIGSNESLKVTAQTGSGVILQAGNVFLVHGTCSSSTWNCAAIPANPGGIADADPNAIPNVANGKSAFYMPPQPVPRYASPLDDVTVSQTNCNTAGPSDLCVPYRPLGSNQPGDWRCEVTGFSNLCGVPCDYFSPAGTCNPPVSGTIRCDARVGGTPSSHLLPWADGSGANAFSGSPAVSNGERYTNLDDDPAVPDPDTTAPLPNPPDSYLYRSNPLGVSGGGAVQGLVMNLRPPFGIPQSGPSTVRFVAFKTQDATPDDTGNPVTLMVSLEHDGTSSPNPSGPITLTGTPTLYEFTVATGQISDYTSMRVRFTFESSGVNDNALKRGGGLAWLEVETPDLDPALPALVPPGYYHEVVVPAGGCAVMDPSAVYTGLQAYQKLGIYRFGGGTDAEIRVEAGSFLIGSGVTLVFDPNFPDPTGGRGIVIGPGGALVINTATVPNPAGATPCTPYAESVRFNPSDPYLVDLPVNGECAAWGIDPAQTTGIHAGAAAWPYCVPDPTTGDTTPCRDRTLYAPVDGYRGVTFYFTPAAWPPSSIKGRFQMQGSTTPLAGIAFKGILYAPYDDVTITGGNGFNTIGQVLAWTAKFNGGSAYIDLDFPYEFQVQPPYLLEPTIRQ